MTLLYSLTLFVSALLLFWVQPMFTKWVLPLLGGSPAVWNTALVFFQATLLLGYLYAHLAPRALGVRRHAILHFFLLGAVFLWLPLGVPDGWAPPVDGAPVLWLVALLAVAIGLPFFALATTAPLVQRWFAATDHTHAKDPYFLYAASNLGSLVALLGYPFVVEPLLGLRGQAGLWGVAYGLFVFLMALAAWRIPRDDGVVERVTGPGSTVVPWRTKALWVLLAFVPSSLLLGVTTHLSTNVAAVPLLWVVPLALYLTTFVLAFARHRVLSDRALARIYPLAVGLFVLLLALEAFRQPPVIAFIPHLAAFFFVAWACHAALARRRPASEDLTAFYLWMSLGGVLGGAFNALLAPVLFDAVVEYPIAVVLACAVSPLVIRFDEARESPVRRRFAWDFGLAAGALAAAGVAVLVSRDVGHERLGMVVLVALTCVAVLGPRRRWLRFTSGAAAVFMVFTLGVSAMDVVERERSFFGIHKVWVDGNGDYTLLSHGTTVHGVQARAPGRRGEPLAYYHEEGPAGQVFDQLDGSVRDVAVVGLGSGGLSCYRRPLQTWTFYEIDPVVLRLARDGGPFDFLETCAPEADVVLGDARLSLRHESRTFDLIVLDAFTSDAIPIHLLTREAVELYLSRLNPDGLLLFHISNGYLDLRPIVARVARELGLAARAQLFVPREEARGTWLIASEWIVLAPDPDRLAFLNGDDRWDVLNGSDASLWTDDFSNIVGVLRWIRS